MRTKTRLSTIPADKRKICPRCGADYALAPDGSVAIKCLCAACEQCGAVMNENDIEDGLCERCWLGFEVR